MCKLDFRMSHFIQSNLKNNEKLILHSSSSFKALFLWVIIYVVVYILFFFLVLIAVLFTGKSIIEVLKIFIELSLNPITWGIPLIFSIKPIITLLTTEFGITNHRIICKMGLIRRNIEEINLSSIESIIVDQSIIGRFLNYGTIIISGRGTSKVIFKDIANVIEVRKFIKNK